MDASLKPERIECDASDWLSDESAYSSSLPASQTNLSFALTAGRLGYWELDLNTGTVIANDLDKACWGRGPQDELTRDLVEQAIHPDDRQRHREAMRRAIEDDIPLDLELRCIWPDNSVHWLVTRGHVVGKGAGKGARKGAGRPHQMVGVTFDVTERKRTEEALREYTRTLEILNRTGAALTGDLDVERIVQTVTDAATELTRAQFGAFFYNVINEQGEAYTLYTLSGVPREAFAKFPMPRNTAVFEPTFRGKGIIRSDDIRSDPRYGKSAPHYGMPKGHLPVRSYLAVPVISHSGEVLGGLFFGHEKVGVFDERCEGIIAGLAAQASIAIDNARLFKAAEREIAERRRFEKHQDLLLAELNHRVKNTLAIVLSISTQTMRHSTSAEEFRSSFEARIIALAQAYDLLTEANWEGASLRAMLECVLEPFQDDAQRRYVIKADRDIRVAPRIAVAMVMAFHELATNAAKYGALSTPTGRIELAWHTEPGKPRRLKIVWTETGGPRVKQSGKKGFGSRLIRGLSQDVAGSVNMHFAADGLVATFDLPLQTGDDDEPLE